MNRPRTHAAPRTIGRMPARPRFLLAVFLPLAALLPLAGCDAGRSPPAPTVESAPVSADADADWPGLFGPHGDNTSPETGLNFDWAADGPPVLWRRPCGQGFGVPAVAGGTVLLFHRPLADGAESAADVGPDEVLEFLDLADGRTLRRCAYPAAFASDYITDRHGGGPYASPTFSPAADGSPGDERDAVFLTDAAGTLRRVDFESAEVVWTRDLAAQYPPAEKPFPTATSPLVLGDRVVVLAGGETTDAGVVCLDRATGDTVWASTTLGQSYGSPKAATVGGRRMVLVLARRALACLDADTGEPLWEEPFELRGVDRMNSTSPVVAGDVVFVGSGPGVGCAAVRFDAGGGHDVLWTRKRGLDPFFNSMVTAGGYVYGFGSTLNDRARLRCLDLADGEVVWTWANDLVYGNLAAADGHLVAVGEYGRIAALRVDPAAPAVVSESDERRVAGNCYTRPVVAHHSLLVRTEREVVRFDLRPAE